MNKFEIFTLGSNTGNQKFGDSFISMYDVLKYIAEHHAEHVLITGDEDVEYAVRLNGNIYVLLDIYSRGNLYMVYGSAMGISYIIDFNGSMLNKATFTWLYHEIPGNGGHGETNDDNDFDILEES